LKGGGDGPPNGESMTYEVIPRHFVGYTNRDIQIAFLVAVPSKCQSDKCG
jgi:hypothetical protein